MNLRVLRTELRRSTAPWAGAAVLLTGLAFLHLIDGSWWRGTAHWTGQWTSLALWTRSLLAFLWPLAVGFGALQGLRDSRSRTAELLASTPRPAWRRAALPAGATALTLTAAFLLFVLQGAVRVLLGGTAYPHLGWVPITLVGALALVAGALLGMGVARALPSALTPPALAVAAFVATVLLQQSADEAVPSGLAPQRIALLGPAVAEVRQVLLTLSASVHLGQTLWLLGMLATGFALLVAVSARTRLLALTPALACATLALLVLPAEPRHTYVVDKAAAALVCDGPVCVTRAHRARLAALAPHGRKALRLLREALGSRAPDSVREETAPRALGDRLTPSPDAVRVDFDDPVLSSARGAEVTRVLVAQGLAPHCSARSARESGAATELAAQSVVAGWVLGDLVLLRGSVHEEQDHRESADRVWQRLRAAPPAEQRARIAEAHTAALGCRGDTLEVLAGGEVR